MKLQRLLLLGTAFLILQCETEPGLEPVNSSIRGTIFFEGDWPEETDIVQVMASTKFPPTGTQDLIFGDPIPFGVDSCEYILWVPPGEYQAIGVVWKEKQQAWNVTNILGMYFQAATDFLPGKVVLQGKKSRIDSVDIFAKFSRAKKHVASSINGTIRVKGEWPKTAQAILAGASVQMIPASLLDIILSAPLPVGQDSIKYTIPVPAGKYRLVGALVIESGAELGFENIAFYKKKSSDFFPGSVEVPTDTSKVYGIDIEIDFTTALQSMISTHLQE